MAAHKQLTGQTQESVTPQTEQLSRAAHQAKARNQHRQSNRAGRVTSTTRPSGVRF